MVLAVFYFHSVLDVEAKKKLAASEASTNPEIDDSNWEDMDAWDWVRNISGILTLCLVIYSLWIEYMQIRSHSKFCKHFGSCFNLLDAAGLLLTLIITVHSLFSLELISIENIGILTSFASCLLMLKIYDWLRLFEKTSFYVKLVELTLEGVGWFMILFLVALVGFGLPMSMLDMNRGENAHLIAQIFGWWFIDALYNQYLLSLGEFSSLSSAEGNPQAQLVLAFFITATFFSSVTMLNMLIAIMGDSFDYAQENKARFSTQTKLDILSTQAPALRQKNRHEEEKVFMIIVRPDD